MEQHSMILINGINDTDIGYIDTFKMIPVQSDCPYNEVVYNTALQVLFVISKEKKTYLQPIKNKADVVIERHYEYNITTPNEIISFVKRFAQNHEAFDYLRYINK